jgi:hypothetical protein
MEVFKMNRTEQKERLKDILYSIADLKNELKGKIKDIELAYRKIDDLSDTIYNLVQVDSWDEEQLKSDILKAIFEDTLTNVHEELYDFKSDLDAYIEELSENKQESLEEKYCNLEDVIEKFDPNQEYDDIENALEHIEEAEEMIKEMRK